jgi:hypothetical protein
LPSFRHGASATDLRDACGFGSDRFSKRGIARLWRHRASEGQENVKPRSGLGFLRERVLFKVPLIRLAPALRILPDFSAICRAKLLILLSGKGFNGTLDLRIGVRVPASQPFIPKNLWDFL